MSTFGNTTAGSALGSSPSSSTIVAALFTAGPTTASLSSVSLYGAAFNNGNVQFAVYDSSGNLIGNSTDVAVTTSAGWYTGTVLGELSDVSGDYYICYICDSNASQFTPYGDATGGSFNRHTAATYGTWPSSESFTSLNSNLISIYFTYTSAGPLGPSSMLTGIG